MRDVVGKLFLSKWDKMNDIAMNERIMRMMEWMLFTQLQGIDMSDETLNRRNRTMKLNLN